MTARTQPASEDALQIQCADFLRFCVPDLEAAGLYWTAVNPKPLQLTTKNRAQSGGLYKRLFASWQRMGMRPGAGDFMFLFRGLLFKIEMKNGAKARQQDSQTQTEREVTAAGGEYYIARSLDEFVDIIRWQGVPMRDMVAF